MQLGIIHEILPYFAKILSPRLLFVYKNNRRIPHTCPFQSWKMQLHWPDESVRKPTHRIRLPVDWFLHHVLFQVHSRQQIQGWTVVDPSPWFKQYLFMDGYNFWDHLYAAPQPDKKSAGHFRHGDIRFHMAVLARWEERTSRHTNRHDYWEGGQDDTFMWNEVLSECL